VYYTYILESKSKAYERYIGHTTDLKQRLSDHNAGKCSHTSKYMPWKLKLYVAFETFKQAQKFEIYLKTGSGHAFAKRHFWID
jgi:predicted GIY-YIG superfamily endonuclease